ncbi:MAG: RecQ family ATP-dependent DNA helicase, partial [Desulfitobacterium hafniense]|nr:RecQ family ATP-dependent DNA helicase [Desulfitobacterium hafniense]
MRKRGEELLKRMFGPDAVFRDGQWEAIECVLKRERTLVVQRTGWGKSVVYFLATKLLSEQGAGVTVLISPLLSLMRNQIEAASRIDIKAESINSTNEDEWDRVEIMLRRGECDVLLVSPERLANQRFLSGVLPAIRDGIGLFVVDEAHCISDWGHDFRPDYRRIVRIINSMPPNMPVMATTATANDRVVQDVEEQLGRNIRVLRGPLTRESLQLQVIKLADQAERLAWLAENIPKMDGSGIIYCLTVADCGRVAQWLRQNGIDALEYNGKLDKELRPVREQMLLHNQVKVLVATVALGMGFDKPDLGFVIHYQRPGSLVEYYQQIGRAGRALENAYAILLNGREDDEIQEYFITSAFPGTNEMRRVLSLIEDSDRGLNKTQIQQRYNISNGRRDNCLKMLEIDGAIVNHGGMFTRTVNPWKPDTARSEGVTALRRHELKNIQEYVETKQCLMKYISLELSDPFAAECGRCANCNGREFFPVEVGREKVLAAIEYLWGDYLTVEPWKQWPNGWTGSEKGRIKEGLLNQEGRVLCAYGDAGWGRTVIRGKYEDGYFSEELVEASVNLIRDKWRTEPALKWVTAVPSLRRPDLVPDFARRLARGLGLEYRQVLYKIKDNPEQKTMRNSFQQASNIHDAFEVRGECLPEPVLLVDDMVDSKW